MKPIPTLFEIQKAIRQNYEGNLLNWMIDKKDKVVEQQVAPLFAAIQERDAEIERLRGLMAEAFHVVEKIESYQYVSLHIKRRASAALDNLSQAKRNISTEPEPAKPETFEAHGETWTRHKPGDPMPVDANTLIYACFADGTENRHMAPGYVWEWGKVNAEEDWIIGYRLADEAKPDPHAHLREAEKAGKVIQVNWGSNEAPQWADCQPGIRFDFAPEFYRVKPWTLPPPPEGKQWHRTDWTEEMLPEGWRPLLLVEPGHTGMQYLSPDGMWIDHDAFGQESSEGSFHRRTRRPLPEPEVWVDLGPEDCPPGSYFKLIHPRDKSDKWTSTTCVNAEGVVIGESFLHFHELRDLLLINRSLSKGKWDPNAWEPCRKLFK